MRLSRTYSTKKSPVDPLSTARQKKVFEDGKPKPLWVTELLAVRLPRRYYVFMENIKVRVENGRITGKAPPGMPDGTELELRLADPGDDLTEEEVAALNKALEAGWRSVEAGRFRLAGDVISELRARR